MNERDIWLAGYKAAMDDFAIHKNGEQLIGVMQERKQDVFSELERSIRPELALQSLREVQDGVGKSR